MVLIKIIPWTVTACAILAFAVWLRSDSSQLLSLRVPGTDRPASEPGLPGVPTPKLGTLTKSDGVPAEHLVGSWPRFRNAHIDGIGVEELPLTTEWGSEGPQVLWAIEVGEGHAGAAVLNGRVYLLDYDRQKQADALRCLSLTDGKEIWQYSYPVKVKRNHGMSRTVPTVTDKYVVTLGPKCHVMCLDAKTGEFRWGLDLVNDFGATVPPWYASQCPLIDNGRAILAPGGRALMIAVDCETGKIVWETPNPRGWSMTHSSIIPLDFAGRRMYVYCASGGVAGVSAEDGSILWDTDAWKINVACVATPVDVGNGRIFLSGGYEAGAMMLQLKQDGERITAKPLFRLAPKTFGSEQHTPIFYRGNIYGVRPDGQMVCLDTSGKVLWESGTGARFPKGYGPWLIAGGKIFVMNGDDGTLSILEATADGFHPLSQAKVLQGHDCWGPMAMAAGRLIVRDLTTMICLDVSPGQDKETK